MNYNMGTLSKFCWVLFVSVFFWAVVSTNATYAQDIVYLVQITANANIRAEPNTQSAVIGQVQIGDSLPLIRQVPDGEAVSGNSLWYEVDVNQQSGFVWSGVGTIAEQLPLETSIDSNMPGRYYYSAVWDADRARMLIFGGEDVRTHSDLFAYIPSDDRWMQINVSNAPSLSGHRAVWDRISDSMFVFGGYTSGVGFQVKNDLWRFDAELSTWQLLSPASAKPPTRSHFAMAIAPERREIIVFGGQFANADEILNDTWIYHIDENRWEQRFPQSDIPGERQAHSAVWDPINQKMLVFGGWNARGPMNAELWSYDPIANEWAFVRYRGAGPAGRFRHVAVWDDVNDEMLIFGGCCGPESFFNDLWSYNPETNSWTPHRFSNTPPASRQRLQGVWDTIGRQVIVYGGLGECDLLNDTWRYSPATREWQQSEHLQASLIARQGHGIGWDSESRSAWLFAGCDGSQSLGDLWRYSPSSSQWESFNSNVLSGVTSPLPRSGHITVWDDTSRHMYVIGGSSATALYGVLNDMWRFDSNTFTWESLSPDGNFPRRYDSAAAWDSMNEQILVYGGSVSEVDDPTEMFSDDLWRYDPRTNSWEQIPHNGQYPGRLAQHGVIWDPIRHRMLIWGGFGFEEGRFVKLYNTHLWGYNVAENAWERLAQTGNRPTALIRFAWAWDTNADMLYLFGGDRAHEPRSNTDPMIYDELWRYDPSTDRWELMSIDGDRPTARTRHQMFFDSKDNNLYVIGGYNTTGYLDEIWRYDTTANTWELVASPDLTSYIVPVDEASFELKR